MKFGDFVGGLMNLGPRMFPPARGLMLSTLLTPPLQERVRRLAMARLARACKATSKVARKARSRTTRDQFVASHNCCVDSLPSRSGGRRSKSNRIPTLHVLSTFHFHREKRRRRPVVWRAQAS